MLKLLLPSARLCWHLFPVPGDAATVAFNEAVTPHAAQFGLETMNMGSIAALGGTLGRTISPIAGATIICAGIAGVDPMEVCKRNALGITPGAGCRHDSAAVLKSDIFKV